MFGNQPWQPGEQAMTRHDGFHALWQTADIRDRPLPDYGVPHIGLLDDPDGDATARRRLSHLIESAGARATCHPAQQGGLMLLDCRVMTRAVRIALDNLAEDRMGALAVVLSSLDTLDAVEMRAGRNATPHLCEPDATEIVFTLRALLTLRERAPMLREGRDGADAVDGAMIVQELARLSDLVATLLRERTPAGPAGLAVRAPAHGWRAMPAADLPSPHGDKPPLTAARVRAVLRARRLREQIIPGAQFADPAWDILLDLMAARLEGSRISVSSLCIAAAVPPTTALRWIRQMTDSGLLERHADGHDARRVFITLSPAGCEAVERWFDASRFVLMEAAGA